MTTTKGADSEAGAIDSKVRDEDWPWRSEVPYGRIQVSTDPPHEIHWQQFGNTTGAPVIVLHGGPGAGCNTEMAQFFDPEHYRIILFDQRGSGFSFPPVHSDPAGGLAHNTTDHLIADIEVLLEALHITGKVHVFGGSWGSTLALAYAIARPERVRSLMLRGIFLGHAWGMDYFYQGNAAHYDSAIPPQAQKFAEEGAYRAYMGDGTLEGQIPRKVYVDLYGQKSGPGFYQKMGDAYAASWERYVRVIDAADRADMVKAYSRIFEHRPTTEAERRIQVEAVLAWTQWEGLTSYLLHQDPTQLGKFDDVSFALTFALIECRYFMNGCYLGGKSGEENRDTDYLMQNVDKIVGIPTYIVHGRHDQVAPFADALELYEGLKNLGGRVELKATDAGHSAMERANALALIEVAARAAKET
jgi:proline iminopeptidase